MGIGRHRSADVLFRVVGQFEEVVGRSIAGDPAAPAHVGCGFVAVARPRLDEALAQAAGIAGVRRVVVQPHLLFRGHVEREVHAAVDLAVGLTRPTTRILTADGEISRDDLETFHQRLLGVLHGSGPA